MRYFFYFTIIFLFTPIVYGSEYTIITEQYPPFNYKENDSVKGLSVDIVRAAFKEADLNSKHIDVFPWARGYRYALKKKNVFIFGMIRAEKREKLFKWVGAIFTAKISLFKLKNRNDIQINTLDDAKKFEIGAILSDAKGEFLVKNGFEKIQYASEDGHNLLKLLHGRFDLAIWDDITLKHLLNKEGVNQSQIEKAFSINDLSTDVYLALSKSSDESLRLKVANGLERIKKNGVYDLILQKHKY